MLLIPIAGFSSRIISNEPLLIAISVGLAYLVVPAYLLHIWPARKRANVKSMHDALLAGELVTVEHQVSQVAQIDEMEDEGFHFLLTTESGDTLFLSGQDLYGPVDRKGFPSTRVRIFSNVVSGLRYGIEPLGLPLESWPVYESLTLEQLRSKDALEDGTYYKQSIPDLVLKLGLRMAPSGATHNVA
ncbi:hypothetical protein [Roseateles sp. LYH14W]|uniref:Uncharacterized protein n=1 Tax=Pelomonas parva TaxID=3299032 RepID=A0ABW7F815_9BURK